MFKKINRENKKGFTLAELLIVVAIIGVLVAISIPIFTTQLEKSREATDLANIRSAYAGIVTEYLTNDQSAASATVEVKQRQDNWQTNKNSATTDIAADVSGYAQKVTVSAKTEGNYEVAIDTSGSVTVK